MGFNKRLAEEFFVARILSLYFFDHVSNFHGLNGFCCSCCSLYNFALLVLPLPKLRVTTPTSLIVFTKFAEVYLAPEQQLVQEDLPCRAQVVEGLEEGTACKRIFSGIGSYTRTSWCFIDVFRPRVLRTFHIFGKGWGVSIFFKG